MSTNKSHHEPQSHESQEPTVQELFSDDDGLKNAGGQDTRRSLIRSTSIISLGTLSSRVLGFFRDVLLARMFGTGLIADAFFVAFRIPNLFRDLVGDGASNAAIVPVLSEYKEQGNKKEFLRFVSIVLTLGMMALATITLLGMIFAPVIVRVMAPGFMADPHTLQMTINLTRLLFPYLIFIGLTAYSMAILYTFRSFGASAFSPCLLNVAMIISALISWKTMAEPIYGVAIGTLIGGVLQLAVQLPPMIKQGVRYVVPKSLNHPGAFKIGKLLLPRLLGGGVYQMTVLIDTFCASLSSIVGPGGISAIYYANRVLQLPMGVFGVALASAVLPTLSGFVQKKDIASMKKMIVFSLENIFFVRCPMTVILLLLSSPIIRLLFQGGKFDLYSTNITSWTLSFLAIGLFSFGGIKILVTAFYALQDTKTPVIVSGICLMLNAFLNIILMVPLKVGGIALASSIAGTVDFLILFYLIDKRLGGLNADLFNYFCKISVASCLTGAIVYTLWNVLHFPNDFIKLCIAGLIGGIFYEIICLFLNVDQAQKVWHWISRKK